MNKYDYAVVKAMVPRKSTPTISENVLSTVSMPCEDYVRQQAGRPYVAGDGKTYYIGQYPHTDARKLVKHWINSVDYASAKGVPLDEDVQDSYRNAIKTQHNPREHHNILVSAYAQKLQQEIASRKLPTKKGK